MNSFMDFVQSVDEAAIRWDGPISGFHRLRSRFRGLHSIPRKIFWKSSIKADYAFNKGGVGECQLNLGLDKGGHYLRYGIAFSYEPTQDLPNPVADLDPRVDKFNHLIINKPWLMNDLAYCYWEQASSANYRHFDAGPIPPEARRKNNFIFLGQCGALGEVTPADVLRLWDRLLPIWAYVEDTENERVTGNAPTREPSFIPSPPPRKPAQTPRVEIKGSEFLRHQEHLDIQHVLYSRLVAEFGVGCVECEHRIPEVGFVDIAVSRASGMTYFEIKVDSDLKGCIRQALGQLLEYTHWGHPARSNKLVIVSRHPLDRRGTDYLEALRSYYQLPIDYMQITLDE